MKRVFNASNFLAFASNYENKYDPLLVFPAEIFTNIAKYTVDDISFVGTTDKFVLEFDYKSKVFMNKLYRILNQLKQTLYDVDRALKVKVQSKDKYDSFRDGSSKRIGETIVVTINHYTTPYMILVFDVTYNYVILKVTFNKVNIKKLRNLKELQLDDDKSLVIVDDPYGFEDAVIAVLGKPNSDALNILNTIKQYGRTQDNIEVDIRSPYWDMVMYSVGDPSSSEITKKVMTIYKALHRVYRNAVTIQKELNTSPKSISYYITIKASVTVSIEVNNRSGVFYISFK